MGWAGDQTTFIESELKGKDFISFTEVGFSPQILPVHRNQHNAYGDSFPQGNSITLYAYMPSSSSNLNTNTRPWSKDISIGMKAERRGLAIELAVPVCQIKQFITACEFDRMRTFQHSYYCSSASRIQDSITKIPLCPSSSHPVLALKSMNRLVLVPLAL